MEATLFSGWIYDSLKPYAAQLDIAHPAMMRAIASGNLEEEPGSVKDLLRPSRAVRWRCFVPPRSDW